MNTEHKKLHDDAVKTLADSGKLVEAGFMSLRLSVIPEDAPLLQVAEMRLAFMAGAQHMLASIITILAPGKDPTAKDLQRMQLLYDEMGAWAKELTLRVAATGRVQ